MTPSELTTSPLSPRSSHEERRTSPRVDLQVGVGFASDTNFYAGFTQDISEGGLFVATHAIKKPGTRLTLSFALPDGHEITAAGVVCWIRDPHEPSEDAAPGMGIRFETLSEPDIEAIRRFIAVREPLFYVS
jgi:uncharacterized protein (TIGR02266 family)